MHLTIPLIVGKLKIKSHRYLRGSERAGHYPMWKIGAIHFIFRRNQPAARDP